MTRLLSKGGTFFIEKIKNEEFIMMRLGDIGDK